MKPARLNLIRLDSLPPMAWCATLRRHDPEIEVVAGRMVERSESGFFEGAWAGLLFKEDFDSSYAFCGSGAKVAKDRVIFCTSTDTLQPIYVYRTGDHLFASNSLPFLLCRSQNTLDAEYLFYDIDIMTIKHGLKRYINSIPTSRGKVEMHYFCNLSVGPDLSTAKVPKNTPAGFPTFDIYRSFLLEMVARLIENAADLNRGHAFEPLATVSTGYDSPACAAIAKAVGCTDAVTLTQTGFDRPESADSGSEIARCLGLTVTEHDPRSYKGRSDFPECEFVASGYGGDDVVFCDLEARLRRKLLLTGYHGDKIWDKRAKEVTSEIVRGDPSGASLLEFRLRVGFINAALPFFGCVRHPEIHRISNADEMRNWSVGSDYDRPIPRRIAEEAGVPRALFGRSKKVIANPYLGTGRGAADAEAFLSPSSLSDFRSFLTEERRAVALAVGKKHKVRQRTVGKPFTSTKIARATARLGFTWLDQPNLRWRYSKDISENAFLIHWAMQQVSGRYQ